MVVGHQGALDHPGVVGLVLSQFGDGVSELSLGGAQVVQVILLDVVAVVVDVCLCLLDVGLGGVDLRLGSLLGVRQGGGERGDRVQELVGLVEQLVALPYRRDGLLPLLLFGSRQGGGLAECGLGGADALVGFGTVAADQFPADGGVLGRHAVEAALDLRELPVDGQNALFQLWQSVQDVVALFGQGLKALLGALQGVVDSVDLHEGVEVPAVLSGGVDERLDGCGQFLDVADPDVLRVQAVEGVVQVAEAGLASVEQLADGIESLLDFCTDVVDPLVGGRGLLRMFEDGLVALCHLFVLAGGEFAVVGGGRGRSCAGHADGGVAVVLVDCRQGLFQPPLGSVVGCRVLGHLGFAHGGFGGTGSADGAEGFGRAVAGTQCTLTHDLAGFLACAVFAVLLVEPPDEAREGDEQDEPADHDARDEPAAAAALVTIAGVGARVLVVVQHALRLVHAIHEAAGEVAGLELGRHETGVDARLAVATGEGTVPGVAVEDADLAVVLRHGEHQQVRLAATVRRLPVRALLLHCLDVDVERRVVPEARSRQDVDVGVHRLLQRLCGLQDRVVVAEHVGTVGDDVAAAGLGCCWRCHSDDARESEEDGCGQDSHDPGDHTGTPPIVDCWL